MALCHAQLCDLGYMPLACSENGAKPCPELGSLAVQQAKSGRLWVQAARYKLSIGETKGQKPILSVEQTPPL